MRLRGSACAPYARSNFPLRDSKTPIGFGLAGGSPLPSTHYKHGLRSGVMSRTAVPEAAIDDLRVQPRLRRPLGLQALWQVRLVFIVRQVVPVHRWSTVLGVTQSICGVLPSDARCKRRGSCGRSQMTSLSVALSIFSGHSQHV